MPHIHWFERQNKLEIPKEKDEVNKREVHECDVEVNSVVYYKSKARAKESI
jgi:hypothetical protein